jgi:two-component system, OmpR family, KDP operon response regulator KdpE
MSLRILVVDDEPQIRRVMRSALSGQGYDVIEARSGEQALEAVVGRPPALVLLDVNLPGMSGLETCRMLRTTSDVPVIMLTVRNTEKDKVDALDAGADDYVTKPFSTPELLARVRAALRRAPAGQGFPPSPIRLGNVEIDLQTRQVTRGGSPVRLTPKELDLLWYLVTHPNRAIPHRELLQAAWGPEYGDEVEYLRVFVNQLRKKIETDPANPRYIVTEPWFGYRFQAP